MAAPLPRPGIAPGAYFARQEASMLIGPSELTASLSGFDYQMTLLPRDLRSASLARVNGWAVTAKSAQLEAARSVAVFLARQPVHSGWSGVRKNSTGTEAVCWAALGEAVIPRIEPKDLPLAQFLDQQIDRLARHAGGNTDQLEARIQAEYESDLAPQQIDSSLPKAAGKLKPRAAAPAELRDM